MDKLLTNNPMAARRFADSLEVDFRDFAAADVLKAARDMVHQGHRLRTHPVTSGAAPNGSPFVSIVLSGEAFRTDFDSVSIIEGAMALYAKLGAPRELPEAVAKDFMLIDCEMLAKDTQNIYEITRREEI
ncbi:MAG: GrdX family protein [Clostridiales bacterium]|nr:GrdX family protein [Clostridiales bacterium]